MDMQTHNKLLLTRECLVDGTLEYPGYKVLFFSSGCAYHGYLPGIVSFRCFEMVYHSSFVPFPRVLVLRRARNNLYLFGFFHRHAFSLFCDHG